MSEEILDLGHVDENGIRADGMANVLTGMGSARDKSQYTYTKSIVFLGQEELESLYGEWLPRRIIDIYAEQATRKGFKVLFGGEGPKAEEVVGVEQVIEDLFILENLMLAAKNSRLYGGSVILMYIDDGRKADQPVDKRNIRSIEGLEVLDRYQIAPVISEENIYDYSKATHYQIIAGDLINQPNLTCIHKDRILRFDGDWLPYRVRQRNYGWGMSNLQVIYDSFRHYWTGLNSAATLLTEFDIFVHKIRGLAAMLGAGKEGQVKDRLVINDMSKSIYRGYAIDAEKEELEFISRNFNGIGEILEKLRIDIIGASKIPHTLLFGESPGGLGSTGRSEERDFAKTLGDYQTATFKRPLKQLMEYILLSKDGPTNGKLPESWRIHFNDLYELNEREKADVRARVAAVDGRYIQLGVLHPQEVADARYGGSEWSMELTLDPSLPRELPMQGQSRGQSQGQSGMAVPPGGRDPMNEENGTLPMDGSREVEDSAGLFLPRDLEEMRGDIDFTDKDLHQQAISVAKNKFKVWPSAVAGAYVTQKYKELYKRKHGSMEKAFKGKKQQAEYFQKQDAMQPLKTSGFILGDDEEAAFVSQEDIDAALNQWKDQAPEKFKDLLEAQDVEPS
ncbi:phge_rel_HI1409, phage-associated protein, HI1409 family [uncultured Caudovirales phage]|uniref:Phge_rel_HI1409, phage-associated protein, HI1409 family n=1 Tax=uncultured Caudovirales phage TaxID=2100421 RepID=A0A6J7X890_9CAUD|nr:phge_rel_HI1409, phage-associated protein, HI1409 family [uncultured Caudovirales phage]